MIKLFKKINEKMNNIPANRIFFKEELTENSRIKKIKQLTLETQLVGLTVDQRDEKQK